MEKQEGESSKPLPFSDKNNKKKEEKVHASSAKVEKRMQELIDYFAGDSSSEPSLETKEISPKKDKDRYHQTLDESASLEFQFHDVFYDSHLHEDFSKDFLDEIDCNSPNEETFLPSRSENFKLKGAY